MQQANVERRNFAWFALVDAEQCRLLCCRLTREGTQRVEERGVLKNSSSISENAPPAAQSSSPGSAEENERRFAAGTADWLTKKAAEHEMNRLVVFAPPRMLGLLRDGTLSLINGHLEEVRDDLMGLSQVELAEHPMVHELVRGRHAR